MDRIPKKEESRIIERLFPEEYPFGEPEYSRLTNRIRQLADSIAGQLDKNGRKKLSGLEDAYLRQSNFAVRSTFEEGFRTAIELLEEVRRRPEPIRAPGAPLD